MRLSNPFAAIRWGRAAEVPTEDPLLAGKLAAAMTRGIQEGDDPRYLKLLGSLKHFSVYSMESSAGSQRFGYAPTISKHDMADSCKIVILSRFVALSVSLTWKASLLQTCPLTRSGFGRAGRLE